MSGASAAQVSAWRRRTKAKLVAEHGGVCNDCKLEFPPFVFDFDHRDPAAKVMDLSNSGRSLSIVTLRAEAAKCDLVCANCHRMRTHKQRCPGCQHCSQSSIAELSAVSVNFVCGS